MRSITILGSTGSIGTQALQVVDLHPERFAVTALSAHANSDLLFEQVRRYRPKMAALTGASSCEVPADLSFCQFSFGPDALEKLAHHAPADDVLVSVSGMVGLRSVLAARKTGRRVLLANKEALVAGGQLVMSACPGTGQDATLLPVDSEHSALFQCLHAANGNPYRRLSLTASGGPFRQWSPERIAAATPREALKHPNWDMGAKISVDSASMFNKALEIIEARWLFDARPEQIDVLIHPQSIVHSLVEFEDGAVIAQLGMPDMRVPIQYAMSYPQRLPSGVPALDLAQVGTLHFERPDPVRYPALDLAYRALRAGGSAACVLNAANEVAVAAFLKGALAFGGIARVVADTLQRVGTAPVHNLEAVEEADRQAREVAGTVVKSLRT
ncbi:MAG: 1-deoxy-D-xylulose-5-phosphate reductoisomerase [Clostridiales bacterium]|nr:1-deoxy-D-xylulose-5-phosphate reductoisomerase [Clostridiales bacterium]